MTLRQFLFDNFGWDIYDWEINDIVMERKILIVSDP